MPVGSSLTSWPSSTLEMARTPCLARSASRSGLGAGWFSWFMVLLSCGKSRHASIEQNSRAQMPRPTPEFICMAPKPGILEEMASSAPYCLVSDFDGTFTRQEFYDLAMRDGLVDGLSNYWTDYAAGRISHFDAIAGIFSNIRCSESRMRELIAEMHPDPKAPDALRALAACGWDAVIVSNGCQWYIELVLEHLGLADAGLT